MPIALPSVYVIMLHHVPPAALAAANSKDFNHEKPPGPGSGPAVHGRPCACAGRRSRQAWWRRRISMAASPSRSAAAGVEVVSVMSNPDQDPHLFETSPAVAAPASRRRRSSSTTAPTTTPGCRSCWPRRRSRAALQSSPPISCTRRPATIRISGTTPPPCRQSRTPLPRRWPKPTPRTPPTIRRGSRHFFDSLKPIDD